MNFMILKVNIIGIICYRKVLREILKCTKEMLR